VFQEFNPDVSSVFINKEGSIVISLCGLLKLFKINMQLTGAARRRIEGTTMGGLLYVGLRAIGAAMITGKVRCEVLGCILAGIIEGFNFGVA
jgi:hypothetical protein